MGAPTAERGTVRPAGVNQVILGFLADEPAPKMSGHEG